MKTTAWIAVLASAGIALGACTGRTSAVGTAGAAPSPAAASGPAAATPSPSLTELQDLLAKAQVDVPKSETMSVDFSLDSLAGGTVSLSSFRGKVVLLNFWATWCGPCKQEMPDLQALYEKLKPRGFEIVAVDLKEDTVTVSSFIKEYRYTFPVLLDTTGKTGSLPLYSVSGIPTSFLLDRQGHVVARTIGIGGPGWTGPERMALLDRLLGS